MQAIIDFLSGKKTYIVAILFAVFNFGASIGWWTLDDATWKAVDILLGSLGFAFLRAGVSKSSPQ